MIARLSAMCLLLALAASGCGSGACRQSPCVPGVPMLQATCKCVPNEDGGPDAAFDARPTD